MRFTRSLASFASFASFAPLAALVLSAAAPAATKPGDDVFVPQIRAHFDSVLVELQSRDLGPLSPDQRARRAELVATLRNYSDRGVFPHNYDFPGREVPQFVDRQTGTLCAVGHLLASTGRRDIVDRVASTNNSVRAVELKGDAAFESWLDENGLTLAEAARIQPSYGSLPGSPPSFRERYPVVPTLANVGVAGLTTLNLMGNRDGHGRMRNWLGFASGIVNFGIGVAVLRDPEAEPLLGMASLAIGTLSTGISTDAMLFRRRRDVEKRKAAETRVAVAPLLPTSGNGAGLSVSLRF